MQYVYVHVLDTHIGNSERFFAGAYLTDSNEANCCTTHLRWKQINCSQSVLLFNVEGQKAENEYSSQTHQLTESPVHL